MRNQKIIILSLISGAIILAVYSCKKEKKETPEIPDAPYELSYGSFPNPNIAADNPLTREGVRLGRMLFYEKRLSRDNSMSCASCHIQAFAFSDTATLSLGVRKLHGKRQAMPVFNMAWNSNRFFWDGRAHLLRKTNH